MSIMAIVDDKFIPLYRVLWISKTPHFCGHEDCVREGSYEVRLDEGESVWANEKERDELLEALEDWQGGLGPGGENWEEEE